MIWKKHRYVEPKFGDARSIRKFAWLPRSLGDDYMIWLGFYHVYQRYDPWPCQPDWREFTPEEYRKAAQCTNMC